MFSSACLLTSLAILFFIFRYRVHVHISISSSPRGEAKRGLVRLSSETSTRDQVAPNRAIARPHKRGASAQVGPRAVNPAQATEGARASEDIASALVNLGCKPKRAQAAAERVCLKFPEADFDTRFREAMREVA
jgi:hypothetical protein